MQTEGTTLSSGARVDVLAVMDAAAGHARCLASFAQDTGAFRANNAQAADLANACAAALAVIEARAAVAELVAAAKAYQAVSGVAPTFGEVRDARKRLFAALSRMEPQS